MDFKFNNKDLSLVPNSTILNAVKCHVKFDGVEHLYEAKTKTKTNKNNAKLAFEIVAQIAQEALGMDCESSDFSLPKGGHMVKFGDYDSWGKNAETSKQRVRDNFNELATVEFYIRHALLALEHQTNNNKRTLQKRCVCI